MTEDDPALTKKQSLKKMKGCVSSKKIDDEMKDCGAYIIADFVPPVDEPKKKVIHNPKPKPEMTIEKINEMQNRLDALRAKIGQKKMEILIAKTGQGQSAATVETGKKIDKAITHEEIEQHAKESAQTLFNTPENREKFVDILDKIKVPDKEPLLPEKKPLLPDKKPESSLIPFKGIISKDDKKTDEELIEEEKKEEEEKRYKWERLDDYLYLVETADLSHHGFEETREMEFKMHPLLKGTLIGIVTTILISATYIIGGLAMPYFIK
jgi:hypothetical protein